jgi:hypothetical protein
VKRERRGLRDTVPGAFPFQTPSFLRDSILAD